MNNWLAMLTRIITLAPYIVAGIEHLHSEKDTATKQQMATEALTMASGVSQVVDPSDTATITAVSAGVAQVVAGISAIHATAPVK